MAIVRIGNPPENIFESLAAQQAIVVLERGLKIRDNKARRREVLRKIRELDS